ncbi:hypothetical protein J4732_17270 [Serratia marcescens]|uniref:Uncharacterized protein n=1 Tax=Serratia marcescens TaxID=615 RepID=A0A939SVF1_SERMA|nr:hypothetical protein [Serratia marcescens]
MPNILMTRIDNARCTRGGRDWTNTLGANSWWWPTTRRPPIRCSRT